jgi:transposase InsO family protein
VVGQHRSTQRYRATEPDYQLRLAKRMNELAERHPRYGYRRIWALLRGEGWEVNRKRIERLWRLEGHRVPPTTKSRQKKGLGSPMNASWNLGASRPNQIWSYDFVASRTSDGRALRILNVVDEHTRVCIGSHVARSIGAGDVQEQLEEMFKAHGKPELLRSDNGREFTSELLADWLSGEGVGQAFIDRGAPQQNPYVERFNGTMRDEVLNGESFHSLLEARVVIAEWIIEYNELRPHRGLGMKTPLAFRKAIKVGSE